MIDEKQFNSLMETLGGLNEAPATNPDMSKEMEDAIKQMAGQISKGPVKTGTPKKISRILAEITFEDPYLAILFSRKNTDYWEDSSISTAGVTVTAGRIQFYYSPQFLAKLSNGEIIFLLKHELYHILRRHKTRGEQMGAVGDKHLAMNIAADSIINRDLLKDRSLTTSKAVPIKGGVFLHKSDISGDYQYVDVMAKKNYKGKPVTEPITQFLWDNYEEQSQEPEDGEKGEPGPPQSKKPFAPKVGDIVSTKNHGEFGRVTKVSGSKANLDIEYDVITEAEAKKALEANTSFLKNEIVFD